MDARQKIEEMSPLPEPYWPGVTRSFTGAQVEAYAREYAEQNLASKEAELAAREAEIARLREALETIESWRLPETSEVWPSGNPVSYEGQYGSNGARSYMREVARAALTKQPPKD